MYTINKLKEYIDASVLRKVSNSFCIRLSKELAIKYDSGIYKEAINNLDSFIQEINNLNIKYPGNARPIFYLYVVPDEEFMELLNFPHQNSKSGGKPVTSYDLDSFNTAFGISQNILENFPNKENTLAKNINNIHEFAHLVHGQFFSKNRILNEGFAECLPLYTMNYESKFDEHRNEIKNINIDEILSAKQLLNMEKEGIFHIRTSHARTCSFDQTYMSSYLFVRGCIERLAEKYSLNRIEATQKFLEVVRYSTCIDEDLIIYLANEINMSQDELLNDKTLQLNVIKNI